MSPETRAEKARDRLLLILRQGCISATALSIYFDLVDALGPPTIEKSPVAKRRELKRALAASDYYLKQHHLSDEAQPCL